MVPPALLDLLQVDLNVGFSFMVQSFGDCNILMGLMDFHQEERPSIIVCNLNEPPYEPGVFPTAVFNHICDESPLDLTHINLVSLTLKWFCLFIKRGMEGFRFFQKIPHSPVGNGLPVVCGPYKQDNYYHLARQVGQLGHWVEFFVLIFKSGI